MNGRDMVGTMTNTLILVPRASLACPSSSICIRWGWIPGGSSTPYMATEVISIASSIGVVWRSPDGAHHFVDFW